MNFNKEMENELKEYGTVRLVKISDEDKASTADWENLERRISFYVSENEAILSQSDLNAALSALC